LEQKHITCQSDIYSGAYNLIINSEHYFTRVVAKFV